MTFTTGAGSKQGHDVASSLKKLVVGQFRNPRGLIGSLAGWIMANRSSNILRNRWTIDLLGLNEGGQVLEIGCGPGVGLAAVLEVGPKVRATGIDHSELMIRKASNRLAADLETGRLRLWHGKLEDFPENDRHDVVFSCNVLQFVESRSQFLDQVKARLKPAGVFATTYQPRGSCASAEAGRRWIAEFAEDLCLADFAEVEIHEKQFGNMPAFCAMAVLAG